MNKSARIALTFILVCLAGLPVAIARTGDSVDPNSVWKNYLRNETDILPSYQFPHASCFRAAAATHGLPESLLLAVARGESDFEETARSKANAHVDRR